MLTQTQNPIDNSDVSDEPLIMFFITPNLDNTIPEYIVVKIQELPGTEFKFFVNNEEVTHGNLMTEINKRENVSHSRFLEIIQGCEQENIDVISN